MKYYISNTENMQETLLKPTNEKGQIACKHRPMGEIKSPKDSSTWRDIFQALYDNLQSKLLH